jgi:RNA polymerase sigma-70 factor (ECF subfamily)
VTPDTRISLLLRVRNPHDQSAWQEFIDIYAPLIYRLARQRGLQDADADDLTQKVLISVAAALEKRPHDHERAKFRTWLRRIAGNAIINALTRIRPDRAEGGSDFLNKLNQHPNSETNEEWLESEYQKQLFLTAAEQIRPEFTTETWDIFWRTAINSESCEDVAAQLNRRLGSIYAARSRIMKRLRERVAELR